MPYRDCFTGFKELLKAMKEVGMERAVISLEYMPIVEVFEEGLDVYETEKPAFDVFLDLSKTLLEELRRFGITEEQQKTLREDSALNVIASPDVCYVEARRLDDAIRSIESDLEYLKEHSWQYDLPEFEFRRIDKDSLEITLE